MPFKYWQGGAPKIAQTRTYVFAATWEADDLIRVTIGTRSYDFVAGHTSIATVLANLVSAWTALNSSLFPEFYELVPTADATTLTLTARTPGNPFTCTLTPLEAGGGASGGQQIGGGTIATTGTPGVSSSSPNDGSIAANWGGGLPVDGDTIVFDDNAVDLLDGLDFSAMNLHVLQYSSYTGKIGRPETNSAGYPEYRRTYLRIGSDDVPIQYVTLGIGPGAGSGRIRIDAGLSTTHFVVHSTGNPADSGFPAVMLKGTDAANTLTVNKGTVDFATGGYDIAAAAESIGTLASLFVGYVSNKLGDATVKTGAGATLAAVDMIGGRLEMNTGATTITKTGGVLTLAGGSAGTAVVVTTLNERGGTTQVVGNTTLTNANISNDGHLDYSQDMRTKAISNPVNIYSENARFSDPFKVLGGVIIDMEQCGNLANINLGQHYRITRGAAA